MCKGLTDISLLYGCCAPNIGLTTYLTRVAVELKRSGVNVNVISDPKEQEPGLFRILESEGIKVHKCMGLSDISRPILPLLYNLVTAERYEVVHLYGIQKSYKMWGMKHLHANFPRITVNLNSLLLTPAWVGTLKSIIAYKLMLDKSCDSIVTVSNFLAEILRTRYDIAQEKIRVIQNGMALDWFDRNMKTEPDAKLLSAIEALKDKPIVCKVGYLYPLKGYEYFLRAAEMVLDQEKDVQFLVVGDGPQLNYLKKYAHTHGLTNNVHFLGQVNYNNIPWLLSKITIGVSTSLMEQYPKVLLEFAAAGKPIVTSDVGDSRCIVDDGVNGYVVPRFDSVTTAHRILDLLSDSNMARQMGSNGRIRVETEFTMNAMVNRLKKHYCSLIE